MQVWYFNYVKFNLNYCRGCGSEKGASVGDIRRFFFHVYSFELVILQDLCPSFLSYDEVSLQFYGKLIIYIFLKLLCMIAEHILRKIQYRPSIMQPALEWNM